MKFIFCILSCFYSIIPYQLEIGKKLPNGLKIIDHDKYIITSPGSVEKGYSIVYQGHEFDVVFNRNRRIKFIFTHDKLFSTIDNIKVGMAYRDIKNMLIKNTLHHQPGWANYYTSKSGWEIAFDYNTAVNNDSKVLFIFQNTDSNLKSIIKAGNK